MTSTQLEEVIHDFDTMLSNYEDDDNVQVNQEETVTEGFLSIITEEDETIVIAECQKCHGLTPLCTECHVKLLNRPDIDDDSNNNNNRKSFRTIVSGYEDDSFEILDCDSNITPTNSNNCSRKAEETLYDAESSMLANSLDRQKGVSYGRGAEVVQERKRNPSKLFRVLDFVDDEESEDCHTPQMFLAQTDSSKYSKGSGGRVIQGLFVESTSRNGTLRRLKVPLNLCIDDDDDGPQEEDDSKNKDEASLDYTPMAKMISDDYYDVFLSAKSQQSHKKKISVDKSIFRISEMDNSQSSQSEVFHSIINSPREEDTIFRSNGVDQTDISLATDDTPDYSEEAVLEQLKSTIASTPEMIPELTAAEKLEDERHWKSVQVGPNNIQFDLNAIQPHRQILSHGGYVDAEGRVAIILFSGCFLPDRSRKEYSYLCDHLFFYVLSTLKELIVENYILVYLHGATPKSCRPTFNWLKRCYQLIDRRLRKNLKGLYLVHPTFWVKALMSFSKLFVSSKFRRKIQFVNTLSDLSLQIPTEHLMVPEQVLKYDAVRNETLRNRRS